MRAMAKKFLHFPEGFLWGAATSAHQVEGGLHNNWTVWERQNAERLASGSQKAYDTPSVHWRAIKDQAQDPANYISDVACDHYNRYEEDFDLAASLGHNAHRLSIEWSRIEPRRGQFDSDEIEHYRRVIRALKKRGMEPFVTLFHWTTPVWVSEQNDWHSNRTANDFLTYVRYVVDNLGSEVKFWTTFNEPEVFCQMSYWQAYWPPEGKSFVRAVLVGKRLIRTHNRAYKIIKSANPDAQVGAVINNVYVEAGQNWVSKKVANIAMFFINDFFISGIRFHQDFIGVNYYFHMVTKGLKAEFSTIDPTDMGWGMYPEGIYHVLKKLRMFKKPIYITECGIADRQDIYRSWYIAEILRQTHRAVADGVDVRGFMYWALIDNFEWDKGFWPRFGLIEIDYVNGRRRKVRSSAKAYAKIIRANGLEA